MLENLIILAVTCASLIATILGVILIVNGFIIKSKSAKFLGLAICIFCGLVYGLTSWWYYANP